jgi:hypothetical protein
VENEYCFRWYQKGHGKRIGVPDSMSRFFFKDSRFLFVVMKGEMNEDICFQEMAQDQLTPKPEVGPKAEPKLTGKAGSLAGHSLFGYNFP